MAITMTTLDRLQELSSQIRRAKTRLEGLRDRAGLHGVNLSGMPHGSGPSDRIGDMVTEIVDAETALKDLEAEYEILRSAVSSWIFLQDTEDLKAATILAMRYLDGAGWAEISRELSDCEGVPVTSSAARKYCQRYLDKHLQNDDESNGHVGGR